jgi:hypothetical protein
MGAGRAVWGSCRRAVAAVAGVVVLGSGVVLPAAPAGAQAGGSERCPSTVDPSTFSSAANLRALNRVMADLGPRPTASTAQLAYVESIEAELAAIGGFTMSDIPEDIDRQLDESASIRVGAEELAAAGAVPYATPTGEAGVSGRLVHVPAGTPISSADVRGAIVLRPAATGGVQHAVFGAVAYYLHDPDLTIDPAAMYERANFGYQQRITDLKDAAAGGAAGLVLVHDFPTAQVAGQYAPYEGVRWEVPAIYVGADEGQRLVQAAAAGESATLRTTASRSPARTRSVIATLPGRSDERIVIQSHTDGMNAIWDNGPAAMLAMARWFAAQPLACRPRTLQFVFTTAHLHLSRSGAFCFASILDQEYESGTVALVVAIEHLGAREFAAVPRTDGGPGRQLVPTGQSELFITFSLESPVVVESLISRVVAHDLRRTFVLRGADAPRVGFPPHRSFGGEGGPYREFLVPTAAGISGPWTLYNPRFGLDELVDFELMRRQTLAFADLVLAVDDVPREVLAGADNAYRPGRALLGTDPLGEPAPHQGGCGPGAGNAALAGRAEDGHAHGAAAVGVLPRTGGGGGGGVAGTGPLLALALAAAGLLARAAGRRGRRYDGAASAGVVQRQNISFPS